MPDVLKTQQLAKRLAVHENTLARWRDEGMPHHAAGGKFVYEWGEVAAWLEDTERGGYLLIAESAPTEEATS